MTISLLQDFAGGQGLGASNYFTYASDLDSNFATVQTAVNDLIGQVAALQGPNALLARDALEINDPSHPGGAVGSGVIGQHSFRVVIGSPTSELDVAPGQALVSGSRVSNASGATFVGSGGAGTRWVNVGPGGSLTQQTSAGAVAGGLDVASAVWNGSIFTGVTQLARIFWDGDDFDLVLRRLAAVGPGGVPTFPVWNHRSLHARLEAIERKLAGLAAGSEGETLGPVAFRGSVGAPGLIPTDGTTYDATTGLFRPAANVVGFAVSGAEVARVAAGQLLSGVTGSAGTPWLARENDPDTGLYFPGTDEVGLSAGGQQALAARRLGSGVHAVSAPTQLRVRTSNLALSLASGSSLVNLVMDTEDEDVGGWFAASSADHTVPTNGGGVYLLSGSVRFDEASAGGTNQNTGNTRRVALSVGGVEVAGQFVASRGNNALTEDTRLSVSLMLPLAAADVVRLAAAQDSGAAMNVDAFLRVVKVW